jgi:hypothetical protein
MWIKGIICPGTVIIAVDVTMDEHLNRFVHWTDNSLLKALDSLGNSEISSRIEAFSSRKLYKKRFEVNLGEYPNAVGNESDVLQQINEFKKEMISQGMEWNAIPLKEVIIPVFDRKVQKELLVQEDSGEEVPVAEYQGFGIDEDQVREKGDTFLHVFARPLSSFSRDDLKSKIADFLKAFQGIGKQSLYSKQEHFKIMPFKIATIIGARPQFIKAATVSRAISGHNAAGPGSVSGPLLQKTIIHTGQHFDANMSEVFFRELEIPAPDYNLGIGGGTHGRNIGRMIEAIEEALVI